MENNNISLYENGLLKKVENNIAITNKLLNLKDFLLIPYFKNGKWGYCNRNREILIECIYDDADFFYCNLARVKKDGLYGFINENSEVVIDFIYADVGSFYGSIAEIKVGNKWGLINPQNEILIKPHYDKLFSRKDETFQVETNGLVGIINNAFELIIEPQFEDIGLFSKDGIALFCDNYGYGFISKNSKIVIDSKFDYAEDFLEGFAIVIEEGQYYLIDTYGNHAISQSFSYLESQEGSEKIMYRCSIDDGPEGIIDSKGNVIIPLVYDRIGNFNEGLVPCCKNGKYGYIDINNNVVIAFQFDRAFSFHDGLAKVENDNNFGFINVLGEIIIPFHYQKQLFNDCFQNGYTTIDSNGKYGIINTKGTIIIPFEYDFVIFQDEFNLFSVSKNNSPFMSISEKGLKYWEGVI